MLLVRTFFSYHSFSFQSSKHILDDIAILRLRRSPNVHSIINLIDLITRLTIHIMEQKNFLRTIYEVLASAFTCKKKQFLSLFQSILHRDNCMYELAFVQVP